MQKTIIDAIWSKIQDVFVSKRELASGLNTKQNVLTAGRGISISNENVISSTVTEEVVTITISSQVPGFDVEGLNLIVYMNEGDYPYTITTNANGVATITVPHDYKYTIFFPSINGCEDIVPIVHLATVSERSIEVEYIAESIRRELVRIHVVKRETGSETNVSSSDIYVTMNQETTTYTTDSNGIIEFYVQHGTQYTISAPAITDFITPTSQTFTSAITARGVKVLYRYITSGLLIIDNEGNDYTLEQWETAVAAQTKTNSDAVLIEVVTNALIDNQGLFGLDIDMVAYQRFPANQSWAGSDVEFSSIPLNGNSSNQPYYYDGLTVSKKIQAEGDEKGISTNAVDKCLELSITTGNQVHEGFLGSIGQWSILWNNKLAVDDIIASVRPDAISNLSARTDNKWTSTQVSAINAYSWAIAASNRSKLYSFAVVPFFAC